MIIILEINKTTLRKRVETQSISKSIDRNVDEKFNKINFVEINILK